MYCISFMLVLSMLESTCWSFIRRNGNKIVHERAHCLP